MTTLTKISPPRASDAVPRERAFRLLDECMRRPAVWVASPAGSGKTTLVSSYLQARGIPCLWYQTDSGDSDIATFFYYLGLAAKKAAPRFRKPLPLLTPEYRMGIPVFARRYFEELYKRLKPPFAIVLDNYQEVPSPRDHQHRAVLRSGRDQGGGRQQGCYSKQVCAAACEQRDEIARVG
jgi:ATP/maltotriose-dependent transcriptional regulator MalT